MGNRNLRALLIGGAALALCACGGGGGGGGSGVGPLPLPPPPPAPTPGIISGATTSQQFAAMGASGSFEGDQAPRLDAAEQLQVRYVQSSNSYEVQLPHSDTWAAISLQSSSGTGPIMYGGETATLWLKSGDYGTDSPLANYQYSSLFEWSDGTVSGVEAIGSATPAAAVPVTGSASYVGQLLGITSEVDPSDGSQIGGSINLAFNFGAGSLSGSISPTLYLGFSGYSLGTINFRDTVYSTGSTTFSGAFDTNVPGLNSFSGLFTGPSAQELIGNFALPYQSPVDGTNHQAAGAFAGRDSNCSGCWDY